VIVTLHESASPPMFLGDYHVEFYAKFPVSSTLNDRCYAALHGESVSSTLVEEVTPFFAVKKFTALTEPTSYGTYLMNHDPRDRSSNIEIAAMCLGGEGVQMAGPWGKWPYTAAHGIMHAALAARVCSLKSLDPMATFDVSVKPDVLQNGPIYVASTHGERAIQTYDTPGPGGSSSEDQARRFGYFAYSGDPDCRWDIAAFDPRDAAKLGSAESARATCMDSASKLRHAISELMKQPFRGMMGLDA